MKVDYEMIRTEALRIRDAANVVINLAGDQDRRTASERATDRGEVDSAILRWTLRIEAHASALLVYVEWLP